MPIKMTIIPDIFDLPFKFIKKENKGSSLGTASYSRSIRVKGVMKTLIFYSSAHAGNGLGIYQKKRAIPPGTAPYPESKSAKGDNESTLVLYIGACPKRFRKLSDNRQI